MCYTISLHVEIQSGGVNNDNDGGGHFRKFGQILELKIDETAVV